MLRTGQTITRIPLARVAARTASLPDMRSQPARRGSLAGAGSSEAAGMVMTLVSLRDGYAFCCASGEDVGIRHVLAHRSGGSSLRERASQALWGHGASRLVSDGGAGAGGTPRHAVRERRFA